MKGLLYFYCGVFGLCPAWYSLDRQSWLWDTLVQTLFIGTTSHCQISVTPHSDAVVLSHGDDRGDTPKLPSGHVIVRMVTSFWPVPVPIFCARATDL
ncbi:uncharacterized protein STEHIDRAFT_125731 [Stereum hirsutum FP-91666 SS1]|uniref:uncharacterized protein n=1 Tax=Stereum hirsutum (strain FP-91666) TaxID=721885 RepID=UPI000444964A|nr:uncharacterized protein STEHIDRAFT_125731 [Stereum hirsutum FP-91666 SS1]EIM80716.1 hypothetical protein STEHIDRAFT_125731 [Stereum hirsutum FP-91666 SS1]